MKLLRLGQPGVERYAVRLDEHNAALLPTSSDERDFSAVLRLAESEAADPTHVVDLRDHRVGPPVRPGKIVCVGGNYLAHVRESNAPVPVEPILFLKAPDTVVGPHDAIVIPRGSEHTDWEVELGVVIGRESAYLRDPAEAAESIAGYVLANDISERHFQLERGGSWDKGKNSRSFCPLGPWMATADEVTSPQDLRLTCTVNGRVYQDSSTADMIFGIGEVVHYISQFMTLYPGDLVLTGTPAGVGMGQRPARYLADGDVVETAGEGLGQQRCPVVPAERQT